MLAMVLAAFVYGMHTIYHMLEPNAAAQDTWEHLWSGGYDISPTR